MLLNYVATYPNDGIVYRVSDMVLCAHADAGYLNKTQLHSRAGAHIFISEDNSSHRFNGAVLTIATIIKFVMASAAEAKLAALFIAAQKNGSPPTNPYRHEVAATTKPYPNRQLYSSRGHKQDHCTKMIQDDGHETMVAKMLGLTISILILLGCRLKELGLLQHQTPSQYIP